MDLVLEVLDLHLLTPYVYPSTWPEDDLLRQFLSLLLVVNFGGVIMYFAFASFSFFFIYDRELMKHPLILENQIRKEITVTLTAIPFVSLPTIALFMLEVRGYSRLYTIDQSTCTLPQVLSGIALSLIGFLIFTDALIYWIHRGLHHRSVYKYLHKVHHRWIVPTPFASHAFHPIDSFLQSSPYHLYPFIFQLDKYLYLALFVIVNIWTVSIHDGYYRVPKLIEPLINGSAHHTDHHLHYNYNYGQYFTLWDRIGGSFRYPSSLEGKGPMDELNKMKEK